MLITVDVGSTLGTFHQPGSIEILADLAATHHGARKSMVAEVTRWFLHVAPEISEELISEVCDYLLIPRHAWPSRWLGGFDAYPYAAGALADLAELGPVVALSNVSVVTGPARMDDVRAQLGEHLDEILTSYQLGTRKPHRRCWHIVADRYRIPLAEIVHIGDRVPEDISGALHAGCRGAILTNTRGADVPEELHRHPQVAVVADLRDAVPVTRAWATRS